MLLNDNTRQYLQDLKQEDPNYYRDALRSLVDEVGVLNARQSVPASDEIFLDSKTGDLKDAMQLVKSLAGVEVDGSNGAVAGYRNAATPLQAARGVYKGDIASSRPANTVGAPYLRVMDADTWADDTRAQAFFDPGSVSATTDPALARAAAMGVAASTGDGAAMIAANKRYDISDDYIDQFLKVAKIGGDGFGSSVRKQGLGGREEEVIDPATGKRVVDLGGPGEKAFYNDRQRDLARVWLQGGGTGLNSIGDDISVPGNSYQMEHNNPFSTSNSQGLAETKDNRVGFLERHVNSEKGAMPPAQYYLQGRLAMLADQEGIKVGGVNHNADVRTSLQNMMEEVNPGVVIGDRRSRNYTVEEFPERVAQNEDLIKRAMNIGSSRVDSPGDNADRVAIIDSDGGPVNLHVQPDAKGRRRTLKIR